MLAQPVAKHLIDDADDAVVLFTETNALPSVGFFASLFALDDFDDDGVRDLLLTFPNGLGTAGFTDGFTTVVRSSRTGVTVLTFPPDTTQNLFKIAHASAVRIEDVNADGVRDIAASRVHGNNLRPRVHSGATGEVIRNPFDSLSTFPWGLSMTPFRDHDSDGEPDLLLGQLANFNQNAAFALWSPGSNAVTTFTPDNLTPPFNQISLGITILDLGVGATGAPEFLGAHFRSSGATSQSSITLFGRDPTAALAGFSITNLASGPTGLHSGAARIPDLNGDGHREIVLTGNVPSPQDPMQRGLPVLSGDIESPFPPTFVEPLGVHRPRLLVDLGDGPEIIEPLASRALVGIADATGDGREDYVFTGTFDTTDAESNPCLVAMCGRTGRVIYAAAAPISADFTVVAEFTRPLAGIGFIGQGALASPGDLNNDGAPDVVVLVHRATESDGGASYTREQLLLTHYLPAPCPGDVDFDRAVNFADLNALLASFGAEDITDPADLNASGAVDFADLNLVLSAFGQSCN